MAGTSNKEVGEKRGTSQPVVKGKRHRECAGDRIHAIVAAARELIVENGLEGLRTRDVAERVGINIATLHYHVPTKVALVELVAQSVKGEFKHRYETVFVEGMTGQQRLRIKLDNFLEVFQDRQTLAIVMYELIELSRRDPAIFEILETMRTRWIAAIEEILRDGQKDGSIRSDLDSTVGAGLIVGTLIGLNKLPQNPAQDWRAITALLEQFFIIS